MLSLKNSHLFCNLNDLMTHLSYMIYFNFPVFTVVCLWLLIALTVKNWLLSNDLSHLVTSWVSPCKTGRFAVIKTGHLVFLARAHRCLLISVQFLFINVILTLFPNLVRFLLFCLNFVILDFPFIFSWFNYLIMPLTQYAYWVKYSVQSTPQPSNFLSHFQGLLPYLAYVLSTHATHYSSKILDASVPILGRGFLSHSLTFGLSGLVTAIKNRVCMIRLVFQARKFFIGKNPALGEVSPVLVISENEGFLLLWGVLDRPQLLPILRSLKVFTPRPKFTNVELVKDAHSSKIKFVHASELHAAIVWGVRTVALRRPTALQFVPFHHELTSSCVGGSPVLGGGGYFGVSSISLPSTEVPVSNLSLFDRPCCVRGLRCLAKVVYSYLVGKDS